MNHMMLLLEDRNIKIMTGVTVTEITGEFVEVILPDGKRWGIEANLVVHAAGIKAPGQAEGDTGPALKVLPKSRLIPALSMKAEEVHIIGDCTEPARILEATEAGELVGRWL